MSKNPRWSECGTVTTPDGTVLHVLSAELTKGIVADVGTFYLKSSLDRAVTCLNALDGIEDISNTITLTPMQFRECIAHLGCMSKSDFVTVFGSEHYWEKFYTEYKRDTGRFICYLDLGNLRLLLAHFKTHLDAHGVK